MAGPTSAERTSFSPTSWDATCAMVSTALHSADRTARRPDGSQQNDARPFDIIVLGGGTFGPGNQPPRNAGTARNRCWGAREKN